MQSRGVCHSAVMLLKKNGTAIARRAAGIRFAEALLAQ
jgi:hypothetical protein